MILSLLTIWALSYLAHLAAYFGLGLLLVAINRSHPERRLQKHERGETRARVEIRQSMISLSVTSFWVAFGIFAQVDGLTLWAATTPSFWSLVLMLALSVVLYDAWFYWGHRLMHTRALIRHHRFHHLSRAPTVWSNYSDGLVDAFAMQSYYLIAPLFLPLSPLVLILHRLFDHVNGQIGHSGFEYFAGPSTRFPSPMVRQSHQYGIRPHAADTMRLQ
jgi:sterol desaturase/sphingolipid hydroxylase (fatty acid hydroxylase superfamily)